MPKIRAHDHPPNRWVRRIGWITLALGVATLLTLGCALKIQAKILTTVWRNPVNRTPAEFNLSYQDVTLTAADGTRLAAWYLPGSRPQAIILVHGIHANREATLPIIPMLAEAGYHILAVDLRGHGQSSGHTLSYGYYEALDVQAAVDYVLAVPAVEQVGAIGYSLGGAAVARAAVQDERLTAIVLQSTFSSLPDAIDDSFAAYTHWSIGPLEPLVVLATELEIGISAEQINSARDLAMLSPRSLLIIHGQNDPLFPVQQAYKMYEAAHSPKSLWVVEGMGHEYPFVEKAEYQRRVLAFFREAFGN